MPWIPQINKRALSLSKVLFICCFFPLVLLLSLMLLCWYVLHAFIYLFIYLIIVCSLLFVAFCIYSNFIMLLLTVFAGTPSQKGQHINTLLFIQLLVFFLLVWSYVCVCVRMLHIKMINIVLLEYNFIYYYSENVIAWPHSVFVCSLFYVPSYIFHTKNIAIKRKQIGTGG